MLQNRVDPFGRLIKTSSRGSWMGNRGILHDEHKNVLRSFKNKAWIICLLAFKNRKREVMSPDRYTELFFLDEATAFAAGHRPCFECRRENDIIFKGYWLMGNPAYGFDMGTPIQEIDKVIHSERVGKQSSKITYEDTVDNISDGTFVALNGEPFIFLSGLLFKWTAAGYEKLSTVPPEGNLTILTPKSIVNTLRAGYPLQIAAH